MLVTDEGTPASTPGRARPGIAPHWVLAGLGVSFVLAFGIAVVLYQRYVAYDRIASQHLVDDPELALRIDLEKVLLYEPFREHLLPLMRRGERNPRLKPRVTRLRQHTNIELGVDIREIVFSTTSTRKRWVVALAGMFPKRGVVEGIHRVLLEESIASRFDPATRQLRFENGVIAAQAGDGVVVFGSDPTAVEQALEPGQEYRRWGLSESHEASLVRRGPIEGSKSQRARDADGEIGPMSIGPMSMVLRVGRPDELAVRVETRRAARTVRSDAERDVGALLAKFANIPASSLKFEVSGPNELAAHLAVTSAELDRAAASLAALLELLAFSRP